MNMLHIRMLGCLPLFLAAFATHGQTLLQIDVRGMNYVTNAAGTFSATSLSKSSLLKEAVLGTGTRLDNLALVYHPGGSSFGDTIDVVDSRTGQVLDWLYGFYFGEDKGLGRAALTNATGTAVYRVDYVYSKQSPYAQGSAFVVKRQFQRGGEWHTRIEARMQFLVRPEHGKPAQLRQLVLSASEPFQPGH